MNTHNIPQQAVPSSEKTQKWKEQTVEAYIQRASFKTSGNSYRHGLLKLYDYYNGKIDNSDYQYVLEPYGKSRENFPSKIRNFPLIKPSIDLLLGEKPKRPFNFTVVVSNSDTITIKEHLKNEKVNENLQQWFVNKLNEAGYGTGLESEGEIELPAQIEESFERSWKDNRAIMAQNALDYLIPYLHLKEEFQKGWFDFMVAGYVFSHRGVRNNEPFYEILNPLDVDYDKNPNIDFVEDGSWVVIRQLVDRSTLVDYFQGKLTTEEIERLQNPKGSYDEQFWYNVNESVFYDEWDTYTELVTLYWKSLKLVKIRKYIDEFGDVLEEIVDEDYEVQPGIDIEVEEEWVNEVWQGFRIDGDIYKEIQPYAHQRSSIDSISKCKLPVNGRAYSDRNSPNISLVMLGVAYQLSYNIFKFRLENAIAKSKDILALMDIQLIPEGWSMDKFMYMVEATGIAWVDYQKEGVQFNPQHQSVMDMSIKTITQYVELLRFIREEWEYVSGVSRQRMGSTSQYEGKGVTEQSIIQSSHITEDLYRKYASFEQRDLQALIDYSQIAWVDGKKAAYVMPDGLEKYLEIDPDTYTHAEFGVFVSDATHELEKLQQLKALGQSAIQNGAPMSIITEIIDSENFVEVKSKVLKAERMMQEFNEQANQVEQQLRQAELAEKQSDRDHESIENEKDRQNKIEIELIKKQLNDAEEDEWKAELESRKLELEREIKSRELAEKERSNKAQEKLKEKEIAVKKKTASRPK